MIITILSFSSSTIHNNSRLPLMWTSHIQDYRDFLAYHLPSRMGFKKKIIRTVVEEVVVNLDEQKGMLYFTIHCQKEATCFAGGLLLNHCQRF